MATVRPAPADLPASLRQVVDYRKSGLSLNHIVGCPLDCGYCVRHLFQNFEMKRPHLIMDDGAAVEALVGHWAFRKHTTPLQIFNRATDPFLPGVKDHLFATLEQLDRRALANPVLVITRWKIEEEDVERLERFRHPKLTVLVTWSGIEDKRIEPLDSAIAETSLKTLHAGTTRVRKILYWRPLIAGVNDSPRHLERAHGLSDYADATVFTGLFHREQIRSYLRAAGVADLYPEVARRKILPREVEQRVLVALAGKPIFRKTSCGVAYVHGIADYNGHYGIREICDICPAGQTARCASAHRRPDIEDVRKLARTAGLDVDSISVDDRRIEVCGSTEQQRYFVQHSLNYQVHDGAHPHLPQRHGRAEVGWE
jgi:DNA repair photolyase